MRVKLPNTLVPRSLAGAVLVDEMGIPRYWFNAWLVLYGSGRKESTQKKTADAVERLHEAVRSTLDEDCLDRLLSDVEIEKLVSVLQGLFIRLRNDDFDKDINNSQTWRYASRFVVRMLRQICLVEGVPNQTELQAAIRRIDEELRSMKTRPDAVSIRIRALPSEVVNDIYDIIDVDSSRNPFRTERNRFRNFVLLLLLLHLGLRRGEMCLLAVDAVYRQIDLRTGVERHWMNVVEPPVSNWDPRMDRPSLKTSYSTRQIPITKEIAMLIRAYVENYRGNPQHIFLFNSQKNRPIALNSINEIFSKISGSLSIKSIALLRDRLSVSAITPHHTRHTAVVVRLKDMLDAGVAMEDAISRIKVFFGWSRVSDMPLHYARAHFEDRLQEIWDRRWDTHVEHLRQLESQEQSHAR